MRHVEFLVFHPDHELVANRRVRFQANVCSGRKVGPLYKRHGNTLINRFQHPQAVTHAGFCQRFSGLDRACQYSNMVPCTLGHTRQVKSDAFGTTGKFREKLVQDNK